MIAESFFTFKQETKYMFYVFLFFFNKGMMMTKKFLTFNNKWKNWRENSNKILRCAQNICTITKFDQNRFFRLLQLHCSDDRVSLQNLFYWTHYDTSKTVFPQQQKPEGITYLSLYVMSKAKVKSQKGEH